MSKSFEDWKAKLEEKASEVVEAPENEVEEAVHNAATQMKDAEYVAMGERPIDEIIKELAAEGRKYRGSISHKGIFEVAAEEKRKIMIVGTGTQRYVFDKPKESD